MPKVRVVLIGGRALAAIRAVQGRGLAGSGSGKTAVAKRSIFSEIKGTLLGNAIAPEICGQASL